MRLYIAGMRKKIHFRIGFGVKIFTVNAK